MKMFEKQKILIKYARKHLGKPYKYGAKPREAPRAFDCSSFTQYLYKKVDIKLPRRAIDQADLGIEVKPKAELLKAGDLIFIKGRQGRYNLRFPQGIGHVAIYVGDGKVINARWNEKDGGAVIEEPVEDFLKRDDLQVIKRVL